MKNPNSFLILLLLCLFALTISCAQEDNEDSVSCNEEELTGCLEEADEKRQVCQLQYYDDMDDCDNYINMLSDCTVQLISDLEDCYTNTHCHEIAKCSYNCFLSFTQEGVSCFEEKNCTDTEECLKLIDECTPSCCEC